MKTSFVEKAMLAFIGLLLAPVIVLAWTLAIAFIKNGVP